MAPGLHTRLLTVDPCRIRVEGELDVATCIKLTTLLDALGTAKDIEADLSRLDFIDCAGLNTLLILHEDHQASGTTFTLLNPSPPLQRLLELTQLSSHFTTRVT